MDVVVRSQCQQLGPVCHLSDAHDAACAIMTTDTMAKEVALQVEIGGKTGTSNKNRDAWFMCVTPKLVTGAWVGGEDQSVHFIRGGEGSVMALPIVGEYMKKIYDDGRFGISRTDQFVRPAMMPRYDCEDEVDSEGRNNPEDDNFFD